MSTTIETKLQTLIDALALYGIHVVPAAAPTSTPTPTPTPIPLPTASLDGTTILPGDSKAMVDAKGNVFSINEAAVILCNGVVDTSTQRVTQMYMKRGEAYQQNADNNWWVWRNDAWVSTSSPVPTPVPTGGNAQPGAWMDGSTAQIKYKLLLPDQYDRTQPYPVLFYLHQLDMGTDWNDLGKWLDSWFNTASFRSRHKVIVVAPLLDQSADPSGQTINFGGVTKDNTGRDAALGALQAVQNANLTDKNAIFITGNSMGGLAAWEMLANDPGRWAGALILAGANYVRDATETARALLDKPIWAVHGSQDTNVPLTWDRNMASLMQQMNSKTFHYTELNMGHDVWDTVYSSTTYLDWLLSQRLSGTPITMTPTPTPSPSPRPTVLPTPVPSSTPTPPASGSRLPLSPGYLSVKGNQYVDSAGNLQRIASIGWSQQYDNIAADTATMRSLGFNCIRYPYVNALLQQQFAQIDAIVAACKRTGMKLILDQHTNEAGTAGDGYGAQQKNGKPWDVGPGTDGTNGAGVAGTVTRQRWIDDWCSIAARYASTDVLIGCDLHNEPLRYGLTTWGDGSATDLCAAYGACGAAILAINPALLIICEGAQDYNIGAPWGDLSVIRQHPVVLGQMNKLVYSVHCYPQTISAFNPDSGDQCVKLMDTAFGFVQRQGIAPVWIGEMGARMENDAERAWANTLLTYMEGMPGGLPMSGSWWAWGQLDGQQPNGIMSNGKPRPEQQVAWQRLLFNR